MGRCQDRNLNLHKQWYTVWDREYYDKIICKYVWLYSFPPNSISSCSMPIATLLPSVLLPALVLQC